MTSSTTKNTTETSDTKEEPPEPPPEKLFLGIFPKKYRSLYVIAALDTICGTLLRTHSSVFLKVCFTLRVALTSVAVWGNIHDHALVITLTPFIYFIYLFMFVIHFTSAVFASDFFETTVWTAELSSYISTVILFHCIVWLQIDFELARADVQFLADLKAKGRINKLMEWEQKQKDKKKQQFWVQVGKLAVHFKKRWNYLAFTGVGIVLSQIFDVCKTMIDAELCQAALYRDAPRVLYLMKLRVVCVFVKSIGHSLQAYYQRMIREYVNHDLRKLSMQQALEQEIGYYDEVGSSSEVHGVAWHKVGRITNELGWHLRCLFEFMVKTIMIIICMMRTDIRFTILLTTMSPVLMTTHQYFSEHCKRLGHLLRDNWEELDRRVSEAIHNIRTLKVFGAEEVELDYIHKLTTECFDQLWADIVYCEARWGFCTFLQNISNVCLYYYSYQMLLNGEIDMATVYVFSSFEGHISWMMNTLSHFFSRTNRLMLMSYKVFKLMERETTHTFAEPGVKPECSGKFEFQNVCMSYPTAKDKLIVDKLSLTINPGEMVAFVGESGCGKSTVLNMMNFMYGNQKGQVLLDGVPITEWNKQHFFENVVTVPQDSILFARTIEDNIKFGREATRKEVEEAAKKANCHTFIKEMDRGYLSIVGERGTNLSGGQKQRISIARALLRKPKVLLLDEATSALDTKSERCVQAALHDLMENNDLSMSIVVIAHRLSTVRKADRIVVFGKGAQIIESGNHEHLMSLGGHYAELVNQQKLMDIKMDEESDAVAASKEEEDEKLSDKKVDAELEDAVESEDEPTQNKALTPLAMQPVVTG